MHCKGASPGKSLPLLAASAQTRNIIILSHLVMAAYTRHYSVVHGSQWPTLSQWGSTVQSDYKAVYVMTRTEPQIEIQRVRKRRKIKKILSNRVRVLSLSGSPSADISLSRPPSWPFCPAAAERACRSSAAWGALSRTTWQGYCPSALQANCWGWLQMRGWGGWRPSGRSYRLRGENRSWKCRHDHM